MSKIPAHIREFMTKHEVAEDEIWLLPGGRSYAIKHGAIERIASRQKITFDAPMIVEANGADSIATILVTGRMGDASAWSFGEASPKNNKNAYCFAMAEKRAKDRVVLKLLETAGTIYSEEEADEFKQTAPVQQPAPPKRDDEAAQAYLKVAKEVVRKFGTAQNLLAWWKDEGPHRVESGVVQGTPEYEELFVYVKEMGEALKQKDAA